MTYSVRWLWRRGFQPWTTRSGKITTAFGSPPGPVSALVGHVSDACGPLVTRTGEHLIHALARDAQRTGELGLIGARLVRSQ